MHAGACSNVAEVRAPAGERVRDEDAVDPAVEDRERGLPRLRDDRSNAGRTRSSASPSDSPPRKRSCSSLIVSEPTNICSSSSGGTASSRPPRHSANSATRCGSTPGATTAAVSTVRGSVLVDDEVELDAGERAVRRGRLLAPALGEQHDLGIGLADVGDLGVPHQIEAPAHAA